MIRIAATIASLNAILTVFRSKRKTMYAIAARTKKPAIMIPIPIDPPGGPISNNKMLIAFPLRFCDIFDVFIRQFAILGRQCVFLIRPRSEVNKFASFGAKRTKFVTPVFRFLSALRTFHQHTGRLRPQSSIHPC